MSDVACHLAADLRCHLSTKLLCSKRDLILMQATYLAFRAQIFRDLRLREPQMLRLSVISFHECTSGGTKSLLKGDPG